MIKLTTGKLAGWDERGAHIQTVAESAHARVLLIGLEPGQSLRDHATPSQVQIQVLTGACVVTEAGRRMGAEAGELVIVPPSSRHRVEGTTRSLLLVTLTPHPAAGRFPAEEAGRLVCRVPHTSA